MTVPAVGTPPSGAGAPPGDPAPGSTPGDPTQTPAPGSEPQNPAPGASQGGDPAPGNEPNQPGQQQSQASTTQDDEPRFSLSEWQQRQEQLQREQQAVEAQRQRETRAAEVFGKGAVKTRDLLDNIAEQLGVPIPSDLRQPLLEHIDEVFDLAREGANATVGAEGATYKRTVNEDIPNAFYDFVGQDNRAAFVEKVNGKPINVWLQTAAELVQPKIEAKLHQASIDAKAALLPEAQREEFKAEAAKAKKPADVEQLFHDRLVAVVGPGGTPRAAARGGPSGALTLADVTRIRSEGGYKTDKEFLDAQNAVLGIKD